MTMAGMKRRHPIFNDQRPGDEPHPPRNFAMAYKPTRRERFWRKMGFHFHLGEHEPDEPWQGWIKTRSGIHFDWRDRLRILVSGHLDLHHTVHTDMPTPAKMHTRFDWEIVPPGGKR